MRLTDNKGANVVVDPVGGATLQGSLLSLGYRGRVVMVGAAGREAMQVDVSSLMGGNRSLSGVFLGAEIATDRVHDNIQRLIDEAARGELKVVVDKTFPLSRAADAHSLYRKSPGRRPGAAHPLEINRSPRGPDRLRDNLRNGRDWRAVLRFTICRSVRLSRGPGHVRRCAGRPDRNTLRAGGETSLSDRYRAVRRASEALARPLSAEDQQTQSMPDTSPAKWHLAHTSWFFETFVLAPYLAGYDLFDAISVTSSIPTTRPWASVIPGPLGDCSPGRRSLTSCAIGACRRGDGARSWPQAGTRAALDLVILGLAHEEQHQELILMDILNLFVQSRR